MSSSNSLNQKAEQIDVQVINEVGELNDSANFDETIVENQQKNEQTNKYPHKITEHIPPFTP